VLGQNLTLGARVGYAIGGGPAAGDKKFLPFHGEVRVGYWFGKAPFAKKGLRPYVAGGGGIAQVDAKLPVTVVDCGDPSGPTFRNDCPLPSNDTEIRGDELKLDAYKKLGQSFINIGGGAMYALSPNSGIQLNLNVMFMLPTSGTVIEPSLGYVFGM
jgi:hypothetical protein